MDPVTAFCLWLLTIPGIECMPEEERPRVSIEPIFPYSMGFAAEHGIECRFPGCNWYASMTSGWYDPEANVIHVSGVKLMYGTKIGKVIVAHVMVHAIQRRADPEHRHSCLFKSEIMACGITARYAASIGISPDSIPVVDCPCPTILIVGG